MRSPPGLQVSGVWFKPQLLLPGVQLPAHTPSAHTAGQVSRGIHRPSTVQISTALPAQRDIPV